MSKSDEFSVLISVYINEKPDYLKEALKSICDQSLQAKEVLIVADGRLTDKLYNIINDFIFNYQNARLLQLPENIGLGLALREGVVECRYEVIARMDSDDVIPSDRFQKQMKLIQDGYDIVSCWSAIFIDNINNIIAVKKRPASHAEIIKLAHRRSPLCHAACMYRKSAVIKAGNYNHRQYYEDYHLWIRMILNGSKFCNIQEPLYYVRTTREQIVRRGGVKYLRKEIAVFFEFYKMGFYSIKDLIINSLIRIPIRVLPARLRAIVMSLIWNR